jgi:hypothetical protein
VCGERDNDQSHLHSWDNTPVLFTVQGTACLGPTARAEDLNRCVNVTPHLCSLYCKCAIDKGN